MGVEGSGTGNPDTGYSGYGSVGQFGLSGTFVASGHRPGDFTGDGVVDRAVFRPSDGRCFDGGGTHWPFGTNGDIPVPAQ